MSERKVAPHRPPLSGSEWLLMGVPFLAAALILTVLGVRKLRERPFIEAADTISAVNFTADGKSVLIHTRNTGTRSATTFSRWNVETHQQEWLSTAPQVRGRISPDGKLYVDTVYKRVVPARVSPGQKRTFEFTVIVRETESGRAIVSWPDKGMYEPQWISGGQELISQSKEPILRDVRTGQIVKRFSMKQWFENPGYLLDLQVSPDGKYAAVVESSWATLGGNPSEGGKGLGRGRMAIISWPDGRKLGDAPGDTYDDCAWVSPTTLRALTGIASGYQKLRTSVATITVPTLQTNWTHYPTTTPDGQLMRPSEAVLSASGEHVALPFARAGMMVYQAESGKAALEVPALKAVTTSIYAPGPRSPILCISPDDRYVVRSDDKKLEFFKLK